MFIIRLANQRVESQPQPPSQCRRCGSRGFHKWGGPKARRVVDISVSEIRTQRYRCENCHKTMTAKPAGVGRAARSQRFTALAGVLYALGLSHRGVETAMALFGHHIDRVSGWRDIQRLGRSVRRRLRSGGAKVVGVDETWVKVKGKSRPEGVVVDVGGRTLNIELTGAGFDSDARARRTVRTGWKEGSDGSNPDTEPQEDSRATRALSTSCLWSATSSPGVRSFSRANVGLDRSDYTM